MKYAVAFDVGGTKILGCLVNEKGKILKKIKTPTPKNKKKFFDKIAELSIELKKGKKVEGIGIGVPCGLSKNKQETITCSNIPNLNHAKLCSQIYKKVKTKILLGNDANLFALGEWAFEYKKKPQNFIGVIVGTGVGGGIIINKQLYTGAAQAGEFGHMQISQTGPKDGDGKIGHLEGFVQAKAIVRTAKKFGLKVNDSKEVSDLAKKGNKKAQKAINNAGYYLGIGLANLVNILDPEVIVLGGGASKAHDLKKEAEKTMKKLWIGKHSTKLRLSSLKTNPAILGAAELVFSSTQKQ